MTNYIIRPKVKQDRVHFERLGHFHFGSSKNAKFAFKNDSIA